MSDTATMPATRAELGRFLGLAARLLAAGRPAPGMFSAAIDADWHAFRTDPAYPAFCQETAGRFLGHDEAFGSGLVPWVGAYEELYGPLPEVWFAEADGSVNAEALAAYRRTGEVRAEWNCSPAPSDG